MGAWGVKLYQDDVTCDVRDEYINWLKLKRDNEEAAKIIIENNMGFIDDEEEPSFWFALADTQWKYGRLLPEVKEKAIKCIEEGNDLLRWEDNPKQYQKRKAVLEELKKKLESEQPPEKKIAKLKFDKALWNVGDLLLYQIQDERLKDNKWYGKYVLFRVVGIAKTNVGSLPIDKYYNEQNVIGLYNWVGNEKIDCAKIHNLEFIKHTNIIMKYPNIFHQKKDLLSIVSVYSGKKIPMLKIGKDSDYSYPFQDDILKGTGMTWESINTIDSSIVQGLKEAEENGTLINET